MKWGYECHFFLSFSIEPVKQKIRVKLHVYTCVLGAQKNRLI